MLSLLLTAPLQRFRNEVHVCTLLHHEDVDVVPLVGVYSTEAHPFGLVYEYMHGLDLRHYMRNEPSAEKLKLVLSPLHFIPFRPANLLMLLSYSWRE